MKHLEQILIPENLKDKFRLEKLEEKECEWIAHFVEKKENIPKDLKHGQLKDKISLNGYMKVVELVDFPLKGKPCYLRLKRRRWKSKDGLKSFHNSYIFHRKGQKCTIRFGIFLKSIGGRARRKFFIAWPNLRGVRKEDFSLVSRIKRIFD